MPPAQKDRWHHARPELAQTHLAQLKRASVSVLALTAPRGAGKTEFVRKDLLPGAAALGYRIGYVDLRTDEMGPDRPLVACLQALALAPEKAQVRAAPLALPEDALPGRESRELPDTLTLELLVREAARRKPLLLALDGAALLGQARHTPLANALASVLRATRSQAKLLLVDRQAGALDTLLHAQNQAFAGLGALAALEPLGSEFLRAAVARVNVISRFELALPATEKALHDAKGDMRIFREFLREFLHEPEAGPATAFERARAKHDPSDAFAARWSQLPGSDQVVLHEAARRADLTVTDPALREAVGAAMGLRKSAATSTVHNTLRRLQAEGLLVKMSAGGYAFEDERLHSWVLATHG